MKLKFNIGYGLEHRWFFLYADDANARYISRVTDSYRNDIDWNLYVTAYLVSTQGHTRIRYIKL